MFPSADVVVMRKIGQFYLQKNNGDYVATEKELKSLNIVSVKCVENVEVWIECSRPGKIIGVRGTNIDKLEQFLGIKVKVRETDSVYDDLVPGPEESDNGRDYENHSE